MIAIAAMSENRVIGANGSIPWHLSEDLRFFKQTTFGHVVLMGRKTYTSLGRPLPGRENVVLTRGPEISGVRTISSFEEIIEPTDGRKLFLIGGAELYRALLPRCDALFLTRVKRTVEGDTYFPSFEDFFVVAEKVKETAEMEILRYVKH